MSVSVLAIGDLHFKINNLNDMDILCDKIFKWLDNHNVDFIVLMGDTLDNHGIVYIEPLCRAVTFIQKLSKTQKVFLLIGNHDRKNNKKFEFNEHPFTSLKTEKNLTVVDDIHCEYIKSKKFVFVPYVFPGLLLKQLSKVEWKDSCAIFGHQEIKGCSMGSITSNEGDEWNSDYPLLISGHIHVYQKLQPNMIYVGTPIQHSYGEHDKKTISLFKFNENDFIEKRIDLKPPRKLLLNITDDEFEQLDISGDFSHTKIKITTSLEKIKSIKKSLKYKKLIDSGVKIGFLKESIDLNSHESFNPDQMDFPKIIKDQISHDPKMLFFFDKCIRDIYT